MKNLFAFLWRFHAFVLFVCLQIFCGWLIMRNDSYQSALLINSANDIAGNYYSKQAEYFEYLKLKQVNEQLLYENAKLTAQLPQSRFGLQRDSVHTKFDSLSQQHYTYIPAKVINNSINTRFNYITLDKGWANGIMKDMGVFSQNHAIGVVKNVSSHFCTVLPILNLDSRTSVKLKKNDAFGSLEWDGISPSYAYIKGIGSHIDVKPNDTIVTTAFTNIFPEGLKIGTVVNSELDREGTFLNIKVRLSLDMSRLNHVYVVNNLLRKEIEVLQDSTKNDK